MQIFATFITKLTEGKTKTFNQMFEKREKTGTHGFRSLKIFFCQKDNGQ